jgi:phage terminase large subunit-like protein
MAVERKRSRRIAGRSAPVRRNPAPWWGPGEAPHVRWPGGTVEIPVVWAKSERRWETPDGLYYFDPAAADFAAGFFPLFLRHHIGEFNGQPFELLDYQRYVVRALFGWKRRDGLRRFRKVFIAVPKGSGKSPLASGLGLFLAFFDHEAGAEVYAAASDKVQARIVFDTAKIMVERSTDLAAACEVYRDSIKLRDPMSTEYYQVLSADAPGKHGFRPHGIIFDEFHAQPTRDLFDTLYRGMGKRRQPVLVMITTAGDDDESICFEEWDYAHRVISGTITDETYLPIIFEMAADDDWTSEAVWRRVNPGYGITVKADYFETECRAAQNEPRKRNSFLQLHGNRWVNQATAWIPVEWYDACRADFTDETLSGLACAAGLDMAQKIDLVAFVVAFRQYLEGPAIVVEVADQDQTTGEEQRREVSLNYRLYLRPFFWLPEETVRDREREGFTSYRTWAQAGLLTITEGATIDYDRVYKDITQKILPRFPLLKQGQIGYDPAFATDIANRLRTSGLTTVEVLQNYQHMNEPCQTVEALIKARRVQHDGHALMRWNVENVAVKRDDAARIRPVKPRKQAKKIDGVVAALMAAKCLALMPEPAPPDDMQVLMCG